MSATLDYTETLVVTHCWCGIAVGLPQTLYEWMGQSSANNAHCPVGHQFHFGNSYKQKLEAEQREHERTRQRVQATRDLLRAEERSHRATKGVVTRMRKRESAGVCPCCNRQFQNVARHMATKHPDYGESPT